MTDAAHFDQASEGDASRAESLYHQGLDLLSTGRAGDAAQAFRACIAADARHLDAHHGLIRALRDAGQLDLSVAAALALSVLTPDDPLAHAALSIALQHAGQVPQAEAAAGRARILEWKQQLQSEPEDQGTPHFSELPKLS